MVFYTDGAKKSETTGTAIVQFFNAKTKSKNWNSRKYIDVIYLELFAIEKAIEFCANKAYSMNIASDIWILTDCANAITRLEKFEFRTHLMEKLHRNCKDIYEIGHNIYIHWIPGHAKISGNLQADEQAKKGLKKIENQDNFMSFQYLNKRIESDKVEKWNSMWQNNTKKGKYYKLHNSNPQQTFFKNFSNREKLIFSTFLQMKIRHGFFKSYLYRLPTYELNQCNGKTHEFHTFVCKQQQ